ncbi:TPA: molecular chaperone [Escherichia coli]|nr:molecular chaperone [Escherichia coli]HAZ3670689.1 molecular chaperone [Escherichia coli]
MFRNKLLNITNGILMVSLLLASDVFAKDDGGIGLDVTRVVFLSSDESVSLRAGNTSNNSVWLLRAWASDYTTNGTKTPFFITPPLVRINPKESMQFRINKLGDSSSLPSDRESVFSINVMAIPPQIDSQGGGKSHIQFAINNKIKLFYRPDSLNDSKSIEKIPESIQVKNNKTDIEIRNPTPYFVTLDKVKINNTELKNGDYMIAPFSSLNIEWKGARDFTFQTINDYGGLTRAVHIYF